MLPIKQYTHNDDDTTMDIDRYIRVQRHLQGLHRQYGNVVTKLLWRQMGLDQWQHSGTTAAMNNRALMNSGSRSSSSGSCDDAAVRSSVSQLFTRRLCEALEMSDWKEVVSAHKCPVTCLSVDTSEQRYLLSAGADATVAVYDMEEDVGIGEHTHTLCAHRGGDGHCRSRRGSSDGDNTLQSSRCVFGNTAQDDNGGGGGGLNSGGDGVRYKRSRFEAICRASRNNSHAYSISCVEWYPHDTGMFVTGSYDRFINIWDTNRMVPVYKFKFPNKVYALSMSPAVARQTTLIAGACRHPNVRLCDMATGAFVQVLSGHKDAVMDVKFSPVDEHMVATGSVDQTIRIWDLRKPGWLFCLDQYHTHLNPKQSHEVMKRFSTRKYHAGTEVPTAHNSLINALAFTPDGRHLLSSGKDNRLRQWDVQTGENTLVSYPGIVNANQTGYRFAISTDGSVVYHPNDGNIGYYDVKSGALLGELEGHYNTVTACVFYDKEQELISAGHDRQIFIWAPKRRNDSFRESLDHSNDNDDSDNWSDAS